MFFWKPNILVFFIFLSFTFFAQPQIDWGPFQENPHRRSSHVWITAEDSNTVFIVKRKYGFKAKLMWYMDAIDKKTKTIIYSRRLVTPLGKEKEFTRLNNIIVLGSKLYLFTSTYRGTTGEFTSYATKINKSTGIKESTIPVYSTVIKNAVDPSFNYVTSPDGKRLLISCVPFNTDENEIKIIDENLQTFWKGKIKTDLKSLGTYKIIIDQKNNIVIYSGDAGTITLLSPHKDQPKTIKVVVPRQTNIYDAYLRIADTGNVYFVGLIKPDKYSVTMGVITAMLDAEGQDIITSQTSLLDSIQLNEITGISRGWKEDVDLFYINDIFFRTKNDIVLIAEQRGLHIGYFPNGTAYNYFPRYMSGYSALRSGYMNTGSYYYKAPVIEHKINLISVFSLSYFGNLNWVKIIPKNQTFPVGEYLSYIATCDAENIYLIYNDNPLNVNVNLPFGPKCMTNPKKAVGVLSVVSNYGKISSYPFYYRNRNEKLMIKPGASLVTGGNKILLLTERKRIFRLGEITLH